MDNIASDNWCQAFANTDSGKHIQYLGNEDDIFARPAITLKNTAIWKSGNGTQTEPYEIK